MSVIFQAEFHLIKADSDVDSAKVTIQLTDQSGQIPCEAAWSTKTATCRFTPRETGDHKVKMLLHYMFIRFD